MFQAGSHLQRKATMDELVHTGGGGGDPDGSRADHVGCDYATPKPSPREVERASLAVVEKQVAGTTPALAPVGRSAQEYTNVIYALDTKEFDLDVCTCGDLPLIIYQLAFERMEEISLSMENQKSVFIRGQRALNLPKEKWIKYFFTNNPMLHFIQFVI